MHRIIWLIRPRRRWVGRTDTHVTPPAGISPPGTVRWTLKTPPVPTNRSSSMAHTKRSLSETASIRLISSSDASSLNVISSILRNSANRSGGQTRISTLMASCWHKFGPLRINSLPEWLRVSAQPLHDARDHFRPLWLVERLVAQVRQNSSIDARQVPEWLATGGWDERIRAPVDHERWNAQPIEFRPGALHCREQLSAPPGRGARLHQRNGEVGDSDGGIACQLISGDRVGHDQGRSHAAKDRGEGALPARDLGLEGRSAQHKQIGRGSVR